MRSIKTIIAALFAVTLLVAGCSANSESTQTSQPASGGKGSVTFVVSDAAADMGAVSEVAVTIDSVEVHAAGGNENWTTVSMASSSFDPVFELLQLRDSGASQLLAQVELEAGTYDQVRLNISKVVVTVTDADGDTASEAKLPSNRLTLHGLLTVEAGGNATADFDFQTDESLHITGEGTYILAPVVKVEMRSNASVNVQSSGRVQISGGRVDRLSADSDSGVTMSQGMNARGESGIGHRVTPDARLALSKEGKLLQVGGGALATGKIKIVTPETAAVTIETESGTELTLHVASDSAITVDGSPAKVSNLSSRRGAIALVAYNAETGALISLSAGGTGKARAQSEARSARAMVELVRGRPDTSVSADLASEAAESGTTVAIGAITAVNPAEGTITVRN